MEYIKKKNNEQGIIKDVKNHDWKKRWELAKK